MASYVFGFLKKIVGTSEEQNETNGGPFNPNTDYNDIDFIEEKLNTIPHNEREKAINVAVGRKDKRRRKLLTGSKGIERLREKLDIPTNKKFGIDLHLDEVLDFQTEATNQTHIFIQKITLTESITLTRYSIVTSDAKIKIRKKNNITELNIPENCPRYAAFRYAVADMNTNKLKYLCEVSQVYKIKGTEDTMANLQVFAWPSSLELSMLPLLESLQYTQTAESFDAIASVEVENEKKTMELVPVFPLLDSLLEFRHLKILTSVFLQMKDLSYLLPDQEILDSLKYKGTLAKICQQLYSAKHIKELEFLVGSLAKEQADLGVNPLFTFSQEIIEKGSYDALVSDYQFSYPSLLDLFLWLEAFEIKEPITQRAFYLPLMRFEESFTFYNYFLTNPFFQQLKQRREDLNTSLGLNEFALFVPLLKRKPQVTEKEFGFVFENMATDDRSFSPEFKKETFEELLNEVLNTEEVEYTFCMNAARNYRIFEKFNDNFAPYICEFLRALPERYPISKLRDLFVQTRIFNSSDINKIVVLRTEIIKDIQLKHSYKRQAFFKNYLLPDIFNLTVKVGSFALPIELKETPLFIPLVSKTRSKKQVLFATSVSYIGLVLVNETNPGQCINQLGKPMNTQGLVFDQVAPYSLLSNMFDLYYGNEYVQGFLPKLVSDPSSPNLVTRLLNRGYLISEMNYVDLTKDHTKQENTILIPLKEIKDSYYLPIYRTSENVRGGKVFPALIEKEYYYPINSSIVGLIGPFYKDTDSKFITTLLGYSMTTAIESENIVTSLLEFDMQMNNEEVFLQMHRKQESWSSFFESLPDATIPESYLNLKDRTTSHLFQGETLVINTEKLLQYLINMYLHFSSINSRSYTIDSLYKMNDETPLYSTIAFDIYKKNMNQIFKYTIVHTFQPGFGWSTNGYSAGMIVGRDGVWGGFMDIFQNNLTSYNTLPTTEFIFAVIRPTGINDYVKSFLKCPYIKAHKDQLRNDCNAFLQKALLTSVLLNNNGLSPQQSVLQKYANTRNVPNFFKNELKSILSAIPYNKVIEYAFPSSIQNSIANQYFETGVQGYPLLRIQENTPLEYDVLYSYYMSIAKEWMVLAKIFVSYRQIPQLNIRIRVSRDPYDTQFVSFENYLKQSPQLLFPVQKIADKDLTQPAALVKISFLESTFNKKVNMYFDRIKNLEETIYDGKVKTDTSQRARDQYIAKYQGDYENAILQVNTDMDRLEKDMAKKKELKSLFLLAMKNFVAEMYKHIYSDEHNANNKNISFKAIYNNFNGTQKEGFQTDVDLTLKAIASRPEYNYDFAKMLKEEELKKIRNLVIDQAIQQEDARIAARIKPLLLEFYKDKVKKTTNRNVSNKNVNADVEQQIKLLLAKKPELIRSAEAKQFLNEQKPIVNAAAKVFQQEKKKLEDEYYKFQEAVYEYTQWMKGEEVSSTTSTLTLGLISPKKSFATEALKRLKERKPTYDEFKKEFEKEKLEFIKEKSNYEIFLKRIVIENNRETKTGPVYFRDLKDTNIYSAPIEFRKRAYLQMEDHKRRRLWDSHLKEVPDAPELENAVYNLKLQEERKKQAADERLSKLVKDVLLARNNEVEARRVIRGRLQGNATGSRRLTVRDTSVEKVLNELKKYIPLTAPHTNRWGDVVRQKTEYEIGQAIVAFEKQEQNAAEAKKRKEEAVAEAYKKQQEAQEKKAQERQAELEQQRRDLEFTYDRGVSEQQKNIIETCFNDGRYILVNKEGDFDWKIESMQDFYRRLQTQYGARYPQPMVKINNVMSPPCNNPDTQKYQERLKFWEAAKAYVYFKEPRKIFADAPLPPTGGFGPAKKQAQDIYNEAFFQKCGPLLRRGGKRKTRKSPKPKQKKRHQTRRKV